MSNTDVYTFGELLTTLRKQRRISQTDLAEKLGTHRNTIGKWERGIGLPESKTIVLELARQLHLDQQETRQLLEASLTAVSPYWNVPYQRNPFFTGRTEILHHLHTVLLAEKTAAITQSHALSGLGGIGKTQMAIEYAYQHAPEYAAVFWIGAETYETLTASFLSIAEILDLSEKGEQDQSKVIAAVIRWLNSHREWLLIYDNVEDIELVKRFLPTSRGGAILFTTRIHALGTLAQTIEVTQMSQQEGIHFLSRRAKLLHFETSSIPLSGTESESAKTIVELMDGLPLALDQAGSYIEAIQCSLSEYQRLFQAAGLRLLDERDVYADHPSSVARTFALAFAQLKKNNPAAAELLTVCALLAPEAIPETFFIEGAAHLGPTFETLAADPLQFNAAIKALLTYSLIQRNATTQTLTIHRLVQVVLKGQLSETALRTWVRRVIGTMGRLFPTDQRMQEDYWPICEQLITHAHACMLLAEQYIENETLCLPLMSHVATYLSMRARYAEAQSLFERAVSVGKRAPSPQPILLTEALHGLAELYRIHGKYSEAESLFKNVLYIHEQTLGAHHPLVATSLERLGLLYKKLGKYEQAKLLLERALRICEQELGFDHPQVATPLNSLGTFYRELGKYEQAEPLLEDALRIWEQVLGSKHPKVAAPLYNLGNVYFYQGKYEKAESYFKRALHIWEQTLGFEHVDVAFPLQGLGDVYIEQGKYEQAETFLQRALCIFELTMGSEYSMVAYPVTSLGILYFEQGKYEQSEIFLQRALRIREQVLGSEHPVLAETLNGLANLYRDQGKYEQAKPLYLNALTLCQTYLNLQHPQVAETLHDFAHFHQLRHQNIEALSLYQQTLTIREQALGLHHPKTNTTRIAYTHLLRELGRVEEAETLEAQVQVSELSSL